MLGKHFPLNEGTVRGDITFIFETDKKGRKIKPSTEKKLIGAKRSDLSTVMEVQTFLVS